MRILGLEFGSWSLKAVEMESRFRKLEILELHEIRLPLELGNQEEATAKYKQAYEQLINRLPSHPEKIVTSIPASQTALRVLKMPIKSRKKVEQMYRFEIEDSIPLKLDESVVEHHVARTPDGSLVFAAIAPINLVKNHLIWLNQVGTDPDWLTFEGMGLINLYLSSRDDKESRTISNPVLLLDIGHQKTNLTITDQQSVEFFRSIPWGGANLTQAIANTQTLSLEEAERKKIEVLNLSPNQTLTPEQNEMGTTAVQQLNAFITEVQHCIVSHRSQFHKEVNEVLITGGSAQLTGIEHIIGTRLDKPVKLFDPLTETKAGRDLDRSKAFRFGEVMGRATVFARKSVLLFNFRKQELAKATSLTEVGTFLSDKNVVGLLKLCGSVAAMLFVFVMIAKPIASKEAEKATDELSTVISKSFRNLPKKVSRTLTEDPDKLRKMIDKRIKDLNKRVKTVDRKREPMIKLVESVSGAFPKNIKVDVNTLTLTDRNLEIEGVIYSGELDVVTKALEALPYFSQVTLKRDGQRFTYRGQVKREQS